MPCSFGICRKGKGFFKDSACIIIDAERLFETASVDGDAALFGHLIAKIHLQVADPGCFCFLRLLTHHAGEEVDETCIHSAVHIELHQQVSGDAGRDHTLAHIIFKELEWLGRCLAVGFCQKGKIGGPGGQIFTAFCPQPFDLRFRFLLSAFHKIPQHLLIRCQHAAGHHLLFIHLLFLPSFLHIQAVGSPSSSRSPWHCRLLLPLQTVRWLWPCPSGRLRRTSR